MRTFLLSSCFLALLSAIMPSSLLSAADLPVVQVPPAPTPAQIKAAKTAYANGNIVAMAGGTVAGFESLFNIAMPQSDSRHRQPPPCMQAVRKLPSGAVRKFLRLSRPFAANDDQACANAFQSWVTKQGLLEETSIPSYWTNVENFSLSGAQHSPADNQIDLDVEVYRANTTDLGSDYYLVLSTITPIIPNYPSSYFLDITESLQASYGNGTIATVNSFGPVSLKNSISIGDDIPFDNNASGVYNAQVMHAPVAGELDTTHSGPVWIFGPLFESKDSYKGQGAAIFQVPTGTSHFTIVAQQSGDFSVPGDDGNDYVDKTTSADILIPISAPQVLTPVQTFAIEGGTASFDVTLSPNLQTYVSSQPDWLLNTSIQFTAPNGIVTDCSTTTEPACVSPQSSFTLSFVVPTLQCGANCPSYTLTLQTYPDYAAIQTKHIPPISTTTIDLVQQSPPAGVLIAGGQDWNGNVLQTADIWDSDTQKVTQRSERMKEARYGHTATLVAPSTPCQQVNANCPTTGRILIAGGFDKNGQALNTTEFYDTVNGFVEGPQMTHAHAEAVALQLQDGRILILGGLDQPDSATAVATAVVDIYDPTTNKFSTTPFSLTTPRWNFAANLLQDGSVLVQGGSNGPADYSGPTSGTAEKLDTCGSGFYPLPHEPFVGREGLSAVTLMNGQVLSMGGLDTTGYPSADVELFTPDGSSFNQLTNLPTGRVDPALVLQEDGNVAIIGGYNLANWIETYDSLSTSISTGPAFMQEERDLPEAVLLEGFSNDITGKILVAGGVVPNTGSSSGERVELYDPKNQTWTDAGMLSASRRQNTTTLYGKYAGSLPVTLGCQ